MPSDNLRALSEYRDRAASWVGHLIHRAAGVSRRRHPALAGEGLEPKLAVLCDSFIRYGSAQAIGLKAAGADVTFYYVDRLGEFADSEADRAPYLDRVAAAGIETIPLPQRSLRHMVSHVAWLHRDLARRGVSTLVVQAHIDPRYATLGWRFPVAMVIHDPRPHSGDYASTYPLPVRAVARLAELTSACVLVHSPRLADQLFPMFAQVPHGCIPHGADVTAEPVLLTEPITLLLIGRLMAYKGVDTALDAFRKIRAVRPDCSLIIAGRGDLGPMIRANAPAGVELRDGYVPDSELEKLMDESRLVLLPYRDATQSGVGLQALARGVPCIVSSAGALPDLVPDDHRGWIVPPGDPDSLAGAVLEAMDHDMSTRRELHRFAERNFAWPVVGEILLSELARLGATQDGSRS